MARLCALVMDVPLIERKATGSSGHSMISSEVCMEVFCARIVEVGELEQVGVLSTGSKEAKFPHAARMLMKFQMLRTCIVCRSSRWLIHSMLRMEAMQRWLRNRWRHALQSKLCNFGLPTRNRAK